LPISKAGIRYPHHLANSTEEAPSTPSEQHLRGFAGPIGVSPSPLGPPADGGGGSGGMRCRTDSPTNFTSACPDAGQVSQPTRTVQVT